MRRISKLSKLSPEELFRLVNASKSIVEVLAQVGLAPSGSSYLAFHALERDLGLDTSHFGKLHTEALVSMGKTRRRPDAECFVRNSTYTRMGIKSRIKHGGLLPWQCALCGQEPLWNGRALTLVLDHINGVPNDHRLVNLRLLCPNCNSQTPTFTGRNKTYQKQRRLEVVSTAE